MYTLEYTNFPMFDNFLFYFLGIYLKIKKDEK